MQILGVNINKISFNKALEKVEFFLNSDKQNYITTPNPEIILACQKDEELKNIINKSDLHIPDGFGLIIASKFKIRNRITGTDLMLAILKKYKNRKYKFILNENGLTLQEDLNKIIKQQNILIDEKNPDVIFVALGCPAQEKWIKNNLNNYPDTKIFMTVGGGVDFLTGKQKRAPEFFRKLGLEWLWRLMKQPKRIKRIIKAVIVFPIKFLFYKENN